MAKQTFTTGQVLTAAQVNSLQSNDFNQTVSVKTAAYVLAAADKGTRIEFNTSGAVTCTVNTGLFDPGDTVIIQNRGAGDVTVTAGTATVDTAGSLVLSQYQSGTLYFISASASIFFAAAVGDLTAVTSGTGISISNAGGPVPTITNSMATTIDAKGDLIVGTGSDAFTRLPVSSTNGWSIVADSSQTTGLAWAAASSGGLTLIATADLSGATAIQFTSIPTTYTHLQCVFINCYSSSSYWNVRFNNDSGNNYNSQASAGSTKSGNSGVAFAGVGDQNTNLGIIPVTFNGTNNGTANGSMTIYNYASTTLQRAGEWQSSGYDGSSYGCVTGTFNYNSTGTAITQIDFIRGSTQTITGKIQLWGVK